MPIELDDARKQRLISELVGFHLQEFDEELSPFRAQQLVDFFMKALGPHVYNQAVQDARAFMQTRLDDLDGEVYENETF